jgi:hypothetical protein
MPKRTRNTQSGPQNKKAKACEDAIWASEGLKKPDGLDEEVYQYWRKGLKLGLKKVGPVEHVQGKIELVRIFSLITALFQTGRLDAEWLGLVRFLKSLGTKSAVDIARTVNYTEGDIDRIEEMLSVTGIVPSDIEGSLVELAKYDAWIKKNFNPAAESSEDEDGSDSSDSDTEDD